MAPACQENCVSQGLDTLRTLTCRQLTLRRPRRTIVLALMVATSTVATFDLYLLASFGIR